MLKFVMAVVIIILGFDIYKISIYEQLIPKLAWSVDTLRLDYIGEREIYKACKKQMVQM